MADKQSLKDFSIFLPIITLIIYIFGYLIISGYLSNYNVVNDDILNLNLLKAGLYICNSSNTNSYNSIFKL